MMLVGRRPRFLSYPTSSDDGRQSRTISQQRQKSLKDPTIVVPSNSIFLVVSSSVSKLVTMNNLTLRRLDPAHLADLVRKSPAITMPLVGASTAVLIWCIKDYRAFLALGPGGVPYNIFGWAAITILVRPFALSEKDATWTGDYPSEGSHQDILDLPPRKYGRAKLAGIAPHRQMTQKAPESMKAVGKITPFDVEISQSHDLADTLLCGHPAIERAVRHYSQKAP